MTGITVGRISNKAGMVDVGMLVKIGIVAGRAFYLRPGCLGCDCCTVFKCSFAVMADAAGIVFLVVVIVNKEGVAQGGGVTVRTI